MLVSFLSALPASRAVCRESLSEKWFCSVPLPPMIPRYAAIAALIFLGREFFLQTIAKSSAVRNIQSGAFADFLD